MIITMNMKQKCSKCSYEWESRVNKPKECPECKSRNWNDERKKEHI